jgi:hypothetical protein
MPDRPPTSLTAFRGRAGATRCCRSSRQRDLGWGEVRDDPRARAIVARKDARFAAARERVRRRLAEERLEGATR